MKTPQHIALLGTTCHEAAGLPVSCLFPDHHALFRVAPAGPAETIHYTGPDQLDWGGKATAVSDLRDYSRRADFSQKGGGGVYNSARHLAGLKRFPEIVAFDSAEGGDAAIQTGLESRGIRHVPLGLHAVGTNVILAKGGPRPSRVCLTSPIGEMAAPGDYEFPLQRRGGLALINSCKSLDLTRRFSDAAREAGLTQYSVVNRALPVGARRTLLLARDAASVMNLQEFAELMNHGRQEKSATPAVPADENTANLERVADALARLGREAETGDVVVTLGARGCLVADRTTGLIAHVCLASAHRGRVTELLSRFPDRICGSGDAIFAGTVASHSTFTGNPRTESRALRAVLDGTVSVVKSYDASLKATPKWCDVRVFAQRFVG